MMENINVNILDTIIFGFIKNVSKNKKCLIDCSKDKINGLYNLSLLYVQYDYLVNPNINSHKVILMIDDITDNVMFLEKIKTFIEKNYNCNIDESIFQEVIQEVISTIKFEILPTNLQQNG